MNKLLILLGLVLLVSTSYTIYERDKFNRVDVVFPITPDEALSIIGDNRIAKAFIEENFLNESARITNVALVWNPEDKSYIWEVRITERACGCKGVEGLNVLNAMIDPYTGAVIDLTTRVGVAEETLARENCMKGCH